MHLVYENVVPNLLKIWEGEVKGSDDRQADFHLSSAQMTELAEDLVKSGRTIPSSVVSLIVSIVSRRFGPLTTGGSLRSIWDR
jgi:hypothetical protein